VYDTREFALEDAAFSSFAHLIGLTREINSALKENTVLGQTCVYEACAHVETCIIAWYSLLPDSKETPLCSDGEVDKLLFQAYMLMHR
jgi:hypothetical protein